MLLCVYILFQNSISARYAPTPRHVYFRLQLLMQSFPACRRRVAIYRLGIIIIIINLQLTSRSNRFFFALKNSTHIKLFSAQHIEISYEIILTDVHARYINAGVYAYIDFHTDRHTSMRIFHDTYDLRPKPQSSCAISNVM